MGQYSEKRLQQNSRMWLEIEMKQASSPVNTIGRRLDFSFGFMDTTVFLAADLIDSVPDFMP